MRTDRSRYKRNTQIIDIEVNETGKSTGMGKRTGYAFILKISAVMLLCMGACRVQAQIGALSGPGQDAVMQLPGRRIFNVTDGRLNEMIPVLADSADFDRRALRAIAAARRQRMRMLSDSTRKAINDSLRLQKELRRADTSVVRYSRIFRDTLPLSRMSAISLVAPGFSQLHNKQYWKIPVLYATVGTALGFGIQAQKQYAPLKREYEALKAQGASQSEIDAVQREMIRQNTKRTLLFAGAAAAYVYFIGDGAVNYPGTASSVKKATTLSTICPGAGQIYNKSYWKVPIVIGGFATMAYIIDWNARGYNRYKRAYELVADGDDTTIDEFNGRYSAELLRNTKNSFRRSRDMAIIYTLALYVLNIVDAHVDAQLKDYDVSDDLAMSVEPAMTNFYTMRAKTNLLGLSLKISF